MSDPTAASPTKRAAGMPRIGVVIGVLLVSAFVMLLNETILSVGLHSVAVDLDVGVGVTTVQWLTSGFLLTMAVIIPITGFCWSVSRRDRS